MIMGRRHCACVVVSLGSGQAMKVRGNCLLLFPNVPNLKLHLLTSRTSTDSKGDNKDWRSIYF